MNHLSCIILDIFCIILVGIIFFSSQKRRFIVSKGHTIFNIFCISLMCELGLDIGCFAFVDQTFVSAYGLHLAFLYNYFLLQVGVVFIWTLYLYIRYINLVPSKKILLLFGGTALACFVPLIINIFTPFMFYVNPETNSYTRQPFMWLFTGLIFIFLIYSLVIMFKKKKSMRRNEFIPFMFVTIAPALGTLLQLAITELTSIVYPTITLSLFVVFLYLSMTEMQVDPLTGLYNRRQFIQVVTSLLTKKNKKKYIVGIMLDLNKFKIINDTYGHNEGDLALANAARILKSAIPKNVFLARYAGDEFVIAFETDDLKDAQEIENRVHDKEAAFNATNKKDYSLVFAIGKMVFEDTDSVTIDSFIETIDKNMYEDKTLKI